MDKLDGKSMDLVSLNIEKLKGLFPEVVTEGKIDFEKLQLMLGENIETKDERYEFTWNGKSQAIRLANKPSTGTLRPDKESSKNWDTTENLYIEGDNLEVLKLLQKNYFNKVKMIYIDPPYNTGNDFVYHDDFRDNVKNYKEITSQTARSNAETSGRYHTDWLNMMYPRLRLARNLLRDDGVIFISINDNECANLKKVCNEVFGEENFVVNAIWRSTDNSNNDAKQFSCDHNYILIYSKNPLWQPNKLSDDSKRSHFKNPDNDPKGPYFDGNPLNSPNYRENLIYDIISPQGITIKPPKNGWRWSKESLYEKIDTGEVYFTSDGTAIRRRTYLYEMKGLPPSSLWNNLEKTGHNRQAKYELLKILSEDVFDTPKPVKLIKYIMNLANVYDNDIVLDFFAGSSTTAHAAMQLNAEDGGNRKFIMVQLPEICEENSEAFKAGYKNICEIGRERIRRAGEKIKEENKDKDGIENLDIGFKVFKLDSSNIKEWDVEDGNLKRNLLNLKNSVKEDRNTMDILYEVMIKLGLDLNSPVEEIRILGKKLFSVGLGYLIACFDENIGLDLIDEIGKKKPEVAVFLDKSFESDVVKTNAYQRLKKYGVKEIKSI